MTMRKTSDLDYSVPRAPIFLTIPLEYLNDYCSPQSQMVKYNLLKCTKSSQFYPITMYELVVNLAITMPPEYKIPECGKLR